jgi:hypothetical protein
MAGQHAGTVLLLVLWTLWLLAALPLLARDWGGVGLVLLFVLLAFLLAFATSLTWRGNVMAWLTAHALLAVAVGILGPGRQFWAATVSLGGLLWVWGEGGWPHGRPVATVIAILAAAVVLVGLGFGCCWMFVVRPLRERVADAARLADAAVRRADQATRSLRAESALLKSERRERQAAEEEGLRQIKAVEQREQFQHERYEQERRSRDRTVERLRVALEDARRDRALRLGAAGRSDDAERDSGQPAAADELAVVGLRFSYVAETPRTSALTPPRWQTDRGLAPDRVRLIIEREVATVPRDRVGDVNDVLEQGRRAHGDVTFRDRFVAAASEYAGERIGDRASGPLTEGWITRDALSVDEIVQALNWSDGWLHGLVDKPLEAVAGTLGIGDPEAAMIGGIGSNIALEPVSREIQDAVRICELVGIGIGLALGFHPLAISCTKSLLRSEINKQLSEVIKDVFCTRDSITVEREQEPAGVARSAADRIAEHPSAISDERNWLRQADVDATLDRPDRTVSGVIREPPEERGFEIGMF